MWISKTRTDVCLVCALLIFGSGCMAYRSAIPPQAKRFEERSAREMLLAMEKTTGHTLSHEDSSNLARGPEEIDLVNSGLEETMIQAYHEIREIKKRHDGQMDLRMASMLAAIDKIALAYADRGIFP